MGIDLIVDVWRFDCRLLCDLYCCLLSYFRLSVALGSPSLLPSYSKIAHTITLNHHSNNNPSVSSNLKPTLTYVGTEDLRRLSTQNNRTKLSADEDMRSLQVSLHTKSYTPIRKCATPIHTNILINTKSTYSLYIFTDPIGQEGERSPGGGE